MVAFFCNFVVVRKKSFLRRLGFDMCREIFFSVCVFSLRIVVCVGSGVVKVDRSCLVWEVELEWYVLF